MPEVIGIDHLYISVSDVARSEIFYDQVMPILGFRKNSFTIDGAPHIQYFNRHFGYVLRPAKSKSPHDPYAPGLHHLCFRVETSAEVGETARRLRAAGIDASGPKLYPEYAPDYHATFFGDPDGLRLEVTNYRAERRQRHDEWEESHRAEIENQGLGTTQGEQMAFAENLKQLPGVENIEKLELIDPDGKVVATIENKPGQAGSLTVYHHLSRRYGAINAAAATEGLALYAEHANDARENPGKHPNIDRLLAVIEQSLSLKAKIHARP